MIFTIQVRGPVIEWLEQLNYGTASRRKVVSLKAGLRHERTGKLSLSF